MKTTWKNLMNNDNRALLLMFAVFFIMALVLLLQARAWPKTIGPTVKLHWDPNTEPDIAGYRVYLQTDSGYTQIADLLHPVTECVFTAQFSGEYYKEMEFRVTAYDNSGNESGMSQPAADLFCITDMLYCDFNFDNVVDIQDYFLMLYRQGSYFGHSFYSLIYDLNRSRGIDLQDLFIAQSQQGAIK